MSNKHYIIKRKGFMVSSFCKKCLCWSSDLDGLEGDICEATKQQIKENRKIYYQSIQKN